MIAWLLPMLCALSSCSVAKVRTHELGSSQHYFSKNNASWCKVHSMLTWSSKCPELFHCDACARTVAKNSRDLANMECCRIPPHKTSDNQMAHRYLADVNVLSSGIRSRAGQAWETLVLAGPQNRTKKPSLPSPTL